MLLQALQHFDKTFSIDEIIEESYNRIGQFDMSGYNLKTARRSLNILFSEWGNRGLHFWEVANTNINLVNGQNGIFNLSFNC